MDEESVKLRYVERKGRGFHPAADRKWLNMMMMTHTKFIYYYVILIQGQLLR